MKRILFRAVLLLLSWSAFFFLGGLIAVDNAIFGFIAAIGAIGFFLLGRLLTNKAKQDQEED